MKRGDYVRVLAEFWADGPNSETPPGHWNTIANGVGDNTNFVKRLGGAGPVVDDLEWDVKTYFSVNAAVHEAGLSRIWGGIHPPVDDFGGRHVGSQCGQAVYALAKKYWDGSVLNTPVTIALRPLSGGTNELRFNTLRGLYYKVQATTNLNLPFSDEPGGAVLALDGWFARTNAPAGNQKYYRTSSSLVP